MIRGAKQETGEFKPEVIFVLPTKKEVMFNPNGLSKEEQDRVRSLASQLFVGLAPLDLERCTFFAEPGWERLSILLEGESGVVNPRIEGCDSNPFDQHYWVGADLVREEEQAPLIFDPIFGYVGTLANAGDVLYGVLTS